MPDVRPEKLGDLQQFIRVVTSTGAVYFHSYIKSYYYSSGVINTPRGVI